MQRPALRPPRRLPRAMLACLATAACLISLPVVAEGGYPARPVTLVVPFGPGGTSDIMARILERRMTETMAASIVVDNKAGAGGAIGMSQLMRAKPDGYTVGLSVIGPEVLQPAIRKTGYSYKDFDHICGTYAVPLMMMVTKDSSFKSVADVMDYARRHPEKLAYGSSGPGTLLHLSMEMLLAKASAKGLHVPYKSSGEMVTGMLGKQIMVFNETPTVSKQYGLRPLAVFADRRLPGYPDVPTAAEAGFPVQATIWGGLIAPKGLPAPVLGKLESACRQVLASPAYRADAERLETPPEYKDAKAFAAFAQRQSEIYGKLIADLDLADK
ncbi:tripartite tricarboxylate transporter substrate binding protein [Cupriavidus pauculus]|uniref:Bug family tripartite tricarboxylate transporter substrate binding protein n=1 Tax=Cupriavidus pauculus TaxID=82633 RepID=UPI001EE2AF1A|nr:tripartite tricarboxylate transporter substrate binding protein [Cupriavidus pauculus]GJG97864.1 tripartite tricarboxylate transporter substrate binding protein [Cupriavidus pauculus]